jgi:lipid A disaccharide synthetase
VQDDFTAANVVARLNEIIPDGPARERMLEGLARVKACLRSQAGAGSDLRPPSERAADIILGLLGRPGKLV